MRNQPARGSGRPFLPVLLALTIACGLQGAARAQDGDATPAAKAKTKAAVLHYASAGQGSPRIADPYYIEFRSRYAQSYGHTFVVFGRGPGPGKKISPNQIAGLHPASNNPIPFWIGHIVPVQSETGASEGDTEEIYVSARYRVLLDKAEYERVVAFIRKLQKSSPMWQEMVYNCNSFVGDIAAFVGLKVPSAWQLPQNFVLQLRDLNSGRPRTPIATDAVQQAASPSPQSLQ